MKNYKIYELSEELGLSNDEIVTFFNTHGQKLQYNSPNTELNHVVFGDLITKLRISKILEGKPELANYFDLEISNSELYSPGAVQEGYVHGIEVVEGDIYASLYHIINRLSKGDLKKFLQQFNSSQYVAELAIQLKREFVFKEIEVKYKNQYLNIKKYPLEVVLDFFKARRQINRKEMIAKTHRLGKVAGELNIGIATLVQFLKAKGYTIEANPNSKLVPEQYELLLNNFKNEASLISKNKHQKRETISLKETRYEILSNSNVPFNTNILKDKGINSLELKNYKRFKELNELSLGEINFFVGPNNSGKSTVVEAVRILLFYLSQEKHDEIYLNRIFSKTFGKLLSHSTDKKKKEFITIKSFVDDCLFEIDFFGANDTSTPSILEVRINNSLFNCTINFEKGDISVSFQPKRIANNKKEFEVEDFEEMIYQKIDQIDERLENEDLSKIEISLLNSERKELTKKLKSLNKKVSENESLKEIISVFIILSESEISLKNIRKISEILNEVFEQNKFLKTGNSNNLEAASNLLNQNSREYEKYLNRIFHKISNTKIHFLEGISVKLPAVLRPNQGHDGLFNSLKYISEVGILTENKHLKIKQFILKWIGVDDSDQNTQSFGLGSNIQLTSIHNEVFNVQILSENVWQNLGDFGLGAQRIFELIFGIAKIIHQKQNEPNSFDPLVLVEEPEAHIHPALQAKLANFFYEVNKEFGIRFIVETHSEYIIRKTQLIGLQNKLFEDQSKNPFTVIYFDKNHGPYEMRYNVNGSFDRDFGEGFYDVASDNLMEMFLLNN